jgi:Tol biopolymer transport system component
MRAALGFVALLAVIAIAIYPFRTLVSERRLSFEKAAVRKLPINSKITGSAAISPDGKIIAYGVDEGGQRSLWLRLADGTGTPKQLTPASDADISGIVFSGDGQSLFFNEHKNGERILYRIPIAEGGSPIAVLEHLDSRITLSPDDKQLAFIRDYPNEGESVLIVTNVDGTQERRIATRKQPSYFYPANGPAWSPDGKMIVAIIEGGSVNASSLIAFEVNGGAETKISTLAAWPRFRDVAWLPDGSDLVLIVTEGGLTATTEIWQLSYPGWEPIRITDNGKFYESLSAGKSSGTLLAVEREITSDIWISPLEGNPEPTQITSTLLSGRGGVCWTPDEKIVYHSREQATDVLQRMNADGSNQQNLTRDSHGNFYPSVTADGRNIVFMSRRTGVLHVWRLDTETGRQLQLTGGSDEQFPQVSVDGKRVYYVSWESGAGTIWQVSINGGQPSQVISESSYYPEVSPDGKFLTYVAFENQASLRKVVYLEGVQTMYTFHGPLARLWLAHWSRTGDALLYLDHRDGAWNVWSQPLLGGAPKQLTHFKEGQIYFFDQSWDGKALVLSRGSESRELVLFKAGS